MTAIIDPFAPLSPVDQPKCRHAAAELGFESETCGRCGGNGCWSYTPRWGTACFDCGRPHIRGSGLRLTKRGMAALAHLTAMRTVTTADLEIGMAIKDSCSNRYRRIRQIDSAPDGAYVVQLAGLTLHAAPDERHVRRWRTTKEKASAIAAALEYQATLTKRGTVRKRRARKAAA